jgi:histidinol phosphatase-like PHP family hydrolase
MPVEAVSEVVDVNAVAGGLLRDLAFTQSDRPKMFGYKRAAAAILGLDRPIADVVAAGAPLTSIKGIGPASARVCAEVLETGRSKTVERAIDESGKRDDIDRRRSMRKHFLSRARAIAVLADERSGGPNLHEYHGDFQMHTHWSDGAVSVAQVAKGCRKRGYEFCAVTDHSYGLPIAGGMSMAEVRDQQDEVDEVNAKYAGEFHMLKGIEANILADGSLDLSDEDVRAFECVVASPHSKLRIADDQTLRLVRVVSMKGVDILGHPRGRKYGSRPGVTAKWKRVFAAAADAGVAIEIDGDPSRQDVDFELARDAAAAGCLFALDSDAHSTRELRYSETAIAHARLAGIPADRIINCWPLERLLDWAAKAFDR